MRTEGSPRQNSDPRNTNIFILDPGGNIITSKRFDGNYDNMYFFYQYDVRGSVNNIIKPDGTLVKGYNYDEFGNQKQTGDQNFKNEVTFTGAVSDSGSVYTT